MGARGGETTGVRARVDLNATVIDESPIHLEVSLRASGHLGGGGECSEEGAQSRVKAIKGNRGGGCAEQW